MRAVERHRVRGLRDERGERKAEQSGDNASAISAAAHGGFPALIRLKYSRIARRSSAVRPRSSSHVGSRNFTARLPGGVGVVRLEFVSALGRRRLTLAGVLALFLLERTAGVEQATEQLLLPRDRRRVESSALERVGERLRFLGQLRGAVAADGVAQLVELLRDLSLLASQRARRRLRLPTTSAGRVRATSPCACALIEPCFFAMSCSCCIISAKPVAELDEFAFSRSRASDAAARLSASDASPSELAACWLPRASAV